MGIKTKIEFADSTINPIMGCTGCELYNVDPSKNHCYAATLVNRYAGKKGWPKEFNKPEHFPKRIEQAIRWPDLTGAERISKPWLHGYPRVIFVNDLSDGFCPGVDPRIWLQPTMDMMAKSPHIWLMLTKWPRQMRKFFEQYSAPSNFWLGVSVLNQKTAWCIEELLRISTSMRIISAEPLLGPIDLDKGSYGSTAFWIDRLDLVIVGGESGPNARPMYLQWVRDIVQQCKWADVPVFVKQMGTAWAKKRKIDLGFYTGFPDMQSVYQLGDRKGSDMSYWPEDLRIREFPHGHNPS